MYNNARNDGYYDERTTDSFVNDDSDDVRLGTVQIPQTEEVHGFDYSHDMLRRRKERGQSMFWVVIVIIAAVVVVFILGSMSGADKRQINQDDAQSSAAAAASVEENDVFPEPPITAPPTFYPTNTPTSTQTIQFLIYPTVSETPNPTSNPTVSPTSNPTVSPTSNQPVGSTVLQFTPEPTEHNSMEEIISMSYRRKTAMTKKDRKKQKLIKKPVFILNSLQVEDEQKERKPDEDEFGYRYI